MGDDDRTLETIARYVEEVDCLVLSPIIPNEAVGSDSDDPILDAITSYVEEVDNLVLLSPASSCSELDGMGNVSLAPSVSATLPEVDLPDDGFMLPPPVVDLEEEAIFWFN